MLSRTRLTHSPVCVGQSFVILPSFKCWQTPTIPLPFTARSVAGEVRYTLCPHIPSCRGASPTGRVLPSPQLLLASSFLMARQGQVEGGQRWLAEGDARWGDHTRPIGERHFSPPFMRQSLLEVSKIFPGNTKKHFQASACQVFISPPEAGRRSS